MNGHQWNHIEVKAYIKSFGYTLLSTKYINYKTKLLVKCTEGHEYEVSFSHFKSGNRCPYCSKVKKLTIEYIKKYIESFGYTLLSNTYTNCSIKLLIQCPESHVFEMSFSSFQNGQRCPVCANNKRKKQTRK